MAVFPFSTKQSKPDDTKMVKEVKEHCEKHCLNFSAVVVALLKKYHEEHIDGRQD